MPEDEKSKSPSFIVIDEFTLDLSVTQKILMKCRNAWMIVRMI